MTGRLDISSLSCRNAFDASGGMSPPFHSESCRVSLNKGAALIANWTIYDRKLFASALSCPGLTPSPDSVCPKYSTKSEPNTHFFGFSFRLAAPILSITADKCLKCSSCDRLCVDICQHVLGVR
jgi:hypothetical protein